MNVIRSLADYTPRPYPVLTIGNFDGIHRGHQHLLASVVDTARSKGGTALVLTFDPHPLRVLSPGTPLRLLIPQEEKVARLQDLGVQEALCLAFDQSFAALTPKEFVFRILRDKIRVREVFVGQQFAFGVKRSGRIVDLMRLSREAGFQVHAVPPVTVEGEIVSSTRIRTLIQAGHVREAAACLGRFYELNGTVLHGAQRGQELGWPTANLRLPPERVIPADGVYATVTVWNGRAYDSVAYIGTRPTFGIGERLLEVYLLNEQAGLYGEDIRVRFVERLRGDMTFETAAGLSAQIGLDVQQARDALKTAPTVALES